MRAVTPKLTTVTLLCLISSLRVLGLLFVLLLSNIVMAQESESRFRVPPHINQQLWNESACGLMANSASAMMTNLGITFLILTAGRFTRQVSSSYLSSLATLILSQGVMRSIDGVRDYYTSETYEDFYTQASLSNVDLTPFSQYLPRRFQFLAFLLYRLKDSIIRTPPKRHPSYSWVYFHDHELNDYVSIVWIPSELADRYDNTAPGQGYFRVTPRNNNTDCNGEPDSDISLKQAIQHLSCKAAEDELFIHLYPRHFRGENRLLLRPFKGGVAGGVYLSPYFYGDGQTAAFFTVPLNNSFQGYSDKYFNSTQNHFAETAEQCQLRTHQLNANPLHQSTFLLIASLMELSQQHWQPRFNLFQTLQHELDFAETLEPSASQPNPELEFNSLESEHLTLLSAGNQGYLSIDRHKSHKHQIIMSLETDVDLSQVRTADLELLQQQRDALWSEHWQLMFNLFAMVASQLLSEQALSTRPVKFLIETDEISESVKKNNKGSQPVGPDDLIIQAGQNGDKSKTDNTGAGRKARESTGDGPSRNTRGQKRQQSQREGDNDSGAGKDGTPPPPRQPAIGASLSELDDEGLHVIIPVKTRKLEHGKLVTNGIDLEEVPRARKRTLAQSSDTSPQPLPRRHHLDKEKLAREEARLKNEMLSLFFVLPKPTTKVVSDSTGQDGSTGSVQESSRRVHFSQLPETPLEAPTSPTESESSATQFHFQPSDSESSPEPETTGKLPATMPFVLAKGLVKDSTPTVPDDDSSVRQPTASSPVKETISQPLPEVAEVQTLSSANTVQTERFSCPFEGCTDSKGVHKSFETVIKLRGHINDHITTRFFKSATIDISIGNKVAAEQRNIACRIGGCNEVQVSTTYLGKHLKTEHPTTIDDQPFNTEFTSRHDEVKVSISLLKRDRGRPKKEVATAEAEIAEIAEIKGQASFTKLLAEAKNHGLKFPRYFSSIPLSTMTDSGAGKNYVTRFGDNWFCTDCNSGLLHTPEGLGEHYLTEHMRGSRYWCPGGQNTHESGVRPSFTSEQEYYQHLWSHKPQSMTDEQARANGWIPMSDFNPFTPYVPPPPATE